MTRKLFPLLLVGAIFALVPSPIQAVCSIDTQPVLHIASHFEACPDTNPVGAFAYLVADPTGTNSSGQDMVCEEAAPAKNGIGQTCAETVGTAGDGIVTILYDWGAFNTGSIGCPNPTAGGNGSNPIILHTIANDGASVTTTVGFSLGFAGYVIEAAHPFDGTNIAPLACTAVDSQALRVNSSIPTATDITLNLTVLTPTIRSDCDPLAWGQGLGTCSGPLPALTPGNIYLRGGACPEAGSMTDLRKAFWAPFGTPDALGNVTITVPLPTVNCFYVGATYTLGGVESPAISGFIPIHPAECIDADGDGVTNCAGDCDDADPSVFPGQIEICNGADDDCDGLVDESDGGTDSDGDGVADACDNCPLTANPGQENSDPDAFGDACDNCVGIDNPAQDDCDMDGIGDLCDSCEPNPDGTLPCGCVQEVTDVLISSTSVEGKGSGTVSWNTSHEINLMGFNVVVIKAGVRTQQNPIIIPCQECATGLPSAYEWIIPKHKGGQGIFVEMLRTDGAIESFGPAIKQ